MSKMPVETDFVSLIEQFMQEKVSISDFCDQFTELWMQKRDATYESQQARSGSQDQILVQKLLAHEIEKEKFDDEWSQLWGTESNICFNSLVNEVHSACSIFSPLPEFEWELDEDKFRVEVRKSLSDFLLCREKIVNGDAT